MIDRVVIDFAKTFGQPGVFLGVERKMTRTDRSDPKSPQMQARGKEDGLLRWTAIVALKVAAFDKSKLENLNITLSSNDEPCKGIRVGQAVTIEGLEMGIMKQEKGGFSQFWSADAIKPVMMQAASNQ